jgi:hypothetical protein
MTTKKDYWYYVQKHDLNTPQDIYNLIKKFPGISYTEIYKTTNISGTGNLSHILNKLILDNKINKININDYRDRIGKGVIKSSVRSIYMTNKQYKSFEEES